ncbi:unnamed protein product, partial [Phaeothamnion confervicola]
VDCEAIVDQVVESYQDEIQEQGIVIVTSVEQTGPVFSDAPRLRLILTDLLKNAIQFRDINKVVTTIEISIVTSIDNWTICVTDNGIGIDPLQQEKVFNLFYRGSEKSTGSGIGLYIIQEAIDKMEGTIKLESTPGIGSTFEITLPN